MNKNIINFYIYIRKIFNYIFILAINMESKNKTKNNDGNNKNKTKKLKEFKKYSLCFPFHINIKIIKDQKIILDLINSIQKIVSLNSNSFLFGLNTTLNLIQKTKNEETLLFIFHKEKMESLYDLILFRAKFNINTYIYFIDEEWQKKFLEIYKLKKLLSFVLLKNDLNKLIFNQIKTDLMSYNINNDNNKKISTNNIQEIIIQTNKK